MPDARYFRSQAEMYFEMAQHMSERHAAESFRLKAAEYLIQADKLEAQQSAASPPATQER